MSNFLSGLVAGLPLCGIGAAYALLRQTALATTFREGDSESATMSDDAMRWLLLSMFGLGPLLLGGIAGLVYGALGSPQSYLLLALGLATFASLLALVSRTPLMVDKIVMNFAVALVLGLLIPRLVGA